MIITTSQLKEDIKKYFEIAQTEDVLVTKNGKILVKISNPYQNTLEMVKGLRGSIKGDWPKEKIREEREKEL